MRSNSSAYLGDEPRSVLFYLGLFTVNEVKPYVSSCVCVPALQPPGSWPEPAGAAAPLPRWSGVGPAPVLNRHLEMWLKDTIRTYVKVTKMRFMWGYCLWMPFRWIILKHRRGNLSCVYINEHVRSRTSPQGMTGLDS